jgi:hypothetical protein
VTAVSEALNDAIGRGVAASRPTASIPGRLYYATDTSTLSRDNGTSWDTIATGGNLTVEEVDGSPTDAAITKIVFPNGTLSIVGHVATYTPSGGALAVQEADGSPTDSAVTGLVFPNDSLSISGHVATVRQVPYGFIGARATRTTDMTGIVTATPTVVAFNGTDSYDTDGFHDPVTNNSRMTIPAGLGGKYLITASVTWDTSTAGALRSTIIFKNGAIAGSFSRTAPASYAAQSVSDILDLIPGDYIEIQVNQDSGSNRTLSGSVVPLWFAIAKLDSGRVGQGIGCRVYNSATQSIPDSAATALTFDTEVFDTDGFHSTSVNTSRMTIPAGLGGKYFLLGTYEPTANGTGRRDLMLRVNGATEIARLRGIGNASYAGFSQVSTIYDLAAGDYVEVTVLQDSGGALNSTALTGVTPAFLLMRLDSGGSAYTGPRWGYGTAFPSGPASGDQFTRTDLNIDFFYDGTRWLSKTLYREEFAAGPSQVSPLSNGQTAGRWAPWHTNFSIWLDTLYSTTYVVTTNNGSNYHTVNLLKYTAANVSTTIVSFTTAADTVANWTTRATAIGAVFDPTAHKEMQIANATTGTPGNLYVAAHIAYRLIGV